MLRKSVRVQGLKISKQNLYGWLSSSRPLRETRWVYLRVHTNHAEEQQWVQRDERYLWLYQLAVTD